MLDGLEAVELNLSVVLKDNEDFRLDGEYFQKGNLEKLRRIEHVGFDYVSDFATITDGIHESIEYCEESEINLISAKSPKENFFDLSSNAHICEEQHLKNPRTALRVGDVVVSSVGTIGNCAVADESILPANSDRHVGIIRSKDSYLPHFISTFLISKYGRFQTLREATGNVQLNLFIYRIKRLKIVKLSLNFQSRIESLVKFAHQKLEQSEALYAEAENLLLDELGLQDWQPTEEKIAVKSFAESFGSTGRLDAEYYQPKYDELMSIIYRCKYKHKPLSMLIEPIRNGADYRNFTEDGTPYIRVADVKNGRVDVSGAAKILVTEKDVKKDIALKVGDILFTRKGSFGNAAVVGTNELSSIISSEIMLLRLLPNIKVLSDYLSVYLNSKVGYLQVERRVHGVAFYSISQPDLAQLEIVVPPLVIQEKIVEKVKQSLVNERESKRLLEIAKRGVEIAIEQDEAAALAWMENGSKI